MLDCMCGEDANKGISLLKPMGKYILYGKTFFFNSVLRPFQDYFSSYETGQSVGGRKRESPEKNHLAQPQAELMSHF